MCLIQSPIQSIAFVHLNNSRPLLRFLQIFWIFTKKLHALRFLYIKLYKIKQLCYTTFWKCLNRRLAPKLYRQLLEFNFGRLLSHNCEFCCFLQSKNGSLATKAKLGKQALACDQCSLI